MGIGTFTIASTTKSLLNGIRVSLICRLFIYNNKAGANMNHAISTAETQNDLNHTIQMQYFQL